MSSSRKCAGRLFQTRGAEAAKLLSSNVLCVRGTARHDLSLDERSQRQRPSQTKSMSPARYRDAWPGKDEKTKHASLKSTRLWTGSQCNWHSTGEMWWSYRLVPVKSRAARHSWTDYLTVFCVFYLCMFVSMYQCMDFMCCLVGVINDDELMTMSKTRNHNFRRQFTTKSPP